ncbi:MAG: GDYXXLXY domain-containing protein [Bacteroidota bacterium]
MKNRLWLFFALVVLLQLAVPAKMIWDQEVILKEGETFKFKTRPYDPHDPFRGKYVRLQFDNTELVSYVNDWEKGDKAFVLLTKDEQGYAQVLEVDRSPGAGWRSSYLETTVQYVWPNEPYRIRISYPFERFYMEESKAPAAEKYFQEVVRDSTRSTYALVKVKKGEAVLMDVQVDGISLVELAKEKVDSE